MEMNRYHRQEILKHFGPAGQQALRAARILVAGAGGLGCPVLQYLAAAGVGRLGVVDDDKVDITNLHRQVLYDMQDVSRLKAEVAAEKIRKMNDGVKVDVYTERLGKDNVMQMISGYDLVIDCTDNFPTRYLLSDACVLKAKPLIYGAVSRFEGQVAVFNYNGSGNYRDLFPDMPGDDEVNNCAETGVLGVLPGIIGSLMAAEAIKLSAGVGELLTDQILTYNALNNQFFVASYSRAGSYSGPTGEEAFMQMDYDINCDTGALTKEQFEQILGDDDVVVVDVREPGELPEVQSFPHLKIPIGELESKVSDLSGKKLVFFCKSGVRSARAAKMITERGGTAFVYMVDWNDL